VALCLNSSISVVVQLLNIAAAGSANA